ncbi:hypothetical protein CPB86DRAFT_830606 [Serendipita vermifera]|nr:hypothetical protein CPB86DRAFT_830606 [Serendipita vermifera]
MNTTDNTEYLDTLQTKALSDSLPYLLEQMFVKSECIPDLVEKGIPLFKTALNNPPTRQSISHAEIFSTILGIAFEVLNNGNIPSSTTLDQNFYIHPFHGNIYRDGIRIYYHTRFPAGFEQSSGTTIGRKIYMRQDRIVDGSNPNFYPAIRTLLHEFAHVKQYRAYLYNYCKAGFGYSDNIMEVDARRQVDELSALFDPIGKQFFKIWKARNLNATLGLPTVKAYSRVGGTRRGTVYSLRMQGGTMYITCRGSTQEPVCS